MLNELLTIVAIVIIVTIIEYKRENESKYSNKERMIYIFLVSLVVVILKKL